MQRRLRFSRVSPGRSACNDVLSDTKLGSQPLSASSRCSTLSTQAYASSNEVNTLLKSFAYLRSDAPTYDFARCSCLFRKVRLLLPANKSSFCMLELSKLVSITVVTAFVDQTQADRL